MEYHKIVNNMTIEMYTWCSFDWFQLRIHPFYHTSSLTGVQSSNLKKNSNHYTMYTLLFE